MSIIIKKISSLTQNQDTYTISIDTDKKTVNCSCPGFQGYGRCKHIKIYRNLIQQTLYPNYKDRLIQNFNNCADLILKIIDKHPNIIYDYNDLVEEVHKHRKYSCETITRSYRRLKEEGQVFEPEELKQKRKTSERVFHDINQWRPNIVFSKQSKLFNEVY